MNLAYTLSESSFPFKYFWSAGAIVCEITASEKMSSRTTTAENFRKVDFTEIV
jgi:hypothetical protein